MLISRIKYWLVRTSTSLRAIESRQTCAFAMVCCAGCVCTWILLTAFELVVDVTKPELWIFNTPTYKKNTIQIRMFVHEEQSKTICIYVKFELNSDFCTKVQAKNNHRRNRHGNQVESFVLVPMNGMGQSRRYKPPPRHSQTHKIMKKKFYKTATYMCASNWWIGCCKLISLLIFLGKCWKQILTSMIFVTVDDNLPQCVCPAYLLMVRTKKKCRKICLSTCAFLYVWHPPVVPAPPRSATASISRLPDGKQQ